MGGKKCSENHWIKTIRFLLYEILIRINELIYFSDKKGMTKLYYKASKKHNFLLIGMLTLTMLGQIAYAQEEVLTLGGSSTLMPAMKSLGETYMKANPSVKIQHTMGTSTSGIKELTSGKIDIACVSRNIHEDEVKTFILQNKKVQAFTVANDAIVVIINPKLASLIDGLTIKELREIFFTGKIQQWSKINPKSRGPIHVYARKGEGSGTAETFSDIITGNVASNYTNSAIKLDSSEDILSAIASDQLGIGFLSLGYIKNKSVELVKIFNKEKKYNSKNIAETILDHSYPLTRKLILIVDPQKSLLAAKFLDFVIGKSGQKIIEQNGFIPIR
jgi:phosphate transport system substrate-binding protein